MQYSEDQPLLTLEATAAAHVTHRPSMGQNEPRILVVEDDNDTCAFFHKVFKRRGWITEFAVDGLSAISQARKFKPDVVVLDIGLPAGDGFSVIQRLKSNVSFSLIPIVVVSSRSPVATEERVLALGARAFLQKPVDADRIVALVDEILHGEAHS